MPYQQRQYCTGCKQTKYHTRQYIVLPRGQKFQYCKSCADKMDNIKPAINQKVPARFQEAQDA